MKESCNITNKPQNLKEFLKSWVFWKPILGLLIGGLAGFLYYYFIGCSSGHCAITSSPLSSIFMGSMFGFIVTKPPCGCQ